MEFHIDAKNQKLGRLASEIATILQGKRNSHYDPRLVGDDKILVKNYGRISVTGKKFKEKIYYRHTGRPGHLKSKTFEEAFMRNPKWVLIEAVRKMLPKNKLNARRLKNLVFVD